MLGEVVGCAADLVQMQTSNQEKGSKIGTNTDNRTAPDTKGISLI
jgi:hypothetical protein